MFGRGWVRGRDGREGLVFLFALLKALHREARTGPAHGDQMTRETWHEWRLPAFPPPTQLVHAPGVLSVSQTCK